MAVHNFYPFSYHHVAEEREEGEDSGKGRRPVDDGKGDMVDLDTVGQVSDAFAILVGMGDDNDFVASVDQFRSELVDMAFNTSRLGVEEVAHHGDIVCSARHRDS
jgi:hypothetical protein